MYRTLSKSEITDAPMWTDWTEWSQCTGTCGASESVRHRSCDVSLYSDVRLSQKDPLVCLDYALEMPLWRRMAEKSLREDKPVSCRRGAMAWLGFVGRLQQDVLTGISMEVCRNFQKWSVNKYMQVGFVYKWLWFLTLRVPHRYHWHSRQ